MINHCHDCVFLRRDDCDSMPCPVAHKPKFKQYKVTQPIVLGFYDSNDALITAGILESDGTSIWFQNEESTTTANAIEIWLAQSKIERNDT